MVEISRGNAIRLQRATYNRKLLADEDAFASALLLLLVDRYSTEFFKWSPTALKMEIEQDFRIDFPRSNVDKVFACVTLLTSNWFYRSLQRFVKICNILSGDEFSPYEFDPADVWECSWGITEAALLVGEEDREPFSDEIRGYIEQILDLEGYTNPPDVLKAVVGRASGLGSDPLFDNDPEFYQAVYQTQKDKTDEVNTMILDNLQELGEQYKLLELSHGNVSELADQLIKYVGERRSALT